MPRSGTFRAFKNSPLNKDVWFALIPLILPILGKEKSPNFFEIQGFTSFCLLKKWCHQESNRGHKDFQSFALPTELWHHHVVLYIVVSITGAKVGIIFNPANVLKEKFTGQ